jgi:hypothetical protein
MALPERHRAHVFRQRLGVSWLERQQEAIAGFHWWNCPIGAETAQREREIFDYRAIARISS